LKGSTGFLARPQVLSDNGEPALGCLQNAYTDEIMSEANMPESRLLALAHLAVVVLLVAVHCWLRGAMQKHSPQGHFARHVE